MGVSRTPATSLIALGALALCAWSGSLPLHAQSASDGVVFGPSDSERLQLLEITRSNQSSLQELLEASRATTLRGAGPAVLSVTSSVSSGSVNHVDSTSFPNLIWSDSQRVLKLDKLGNQCTVSGPAGAVPVDPCL